MFTGLVLGTGRITARRSGRDETELTVEPDFEWDEPLVVGESVAVSGVCLTVTTLQGPKSFTAYASSETLKVTTLARENLVNLERALKLSERLGGHLVSGHVDALGRLESQTARGKSLKCIFSFPRELAPYIVPKGSIAVDGVSLTVNEVTIDRMTINIIPQTSSVTTLSGLKPGQQVNLETDILGRYVKRLLEFGLKPAANEPSSGLTIEELILNGF
ncbi:MAG: riboflavin synthase [Deltaproteobacteria bacterium]|jgi:riboflavin synthase|nr:riboflavin synthase [Deltaproteobacteria bacterium]